MSSAPSPTTVRPVVLALAPTAPGLSQGASIPCLERLGGSRLIDRLLGTLHGAGLPAPLVITTAPAHAVLRATLGRSMPVIASAGGRDGALRAALERSSEELLLVHDAERALTPGTVVRDVLAALRQEDDAVVPVIPLTDSVKEVRPDGLRNIDRSTLTGLQSPRLVRRRMLESVLPMDSSAPQQPASSAGSGHAEHADAGGFDEIRAAVAQGLQVRTVQGSHAGFAVRDRLSLWQAQISLGLARDTSHRHGLARPS
ncbi:4-diphosphocytidyl-2C-methyl-D-erythritol kinase [Brachybacterium avium]|uniref:4-diphosphocytidyl-2C-methyl-D-erythritol kinase n=1 Tax=Brachybacterium avium TaxID=2017485 RepID=A0A220UE83_9MICO|nr:2-C-methyl-D-erythritol 4-phosphate cytidylyltransferase [Brachybacterium avium]ASK66518.1 4-diphosphocytidyl-2C-methyl-D-erythritol kinase [Brachybacterium avium]